MKAPTTIPYWAAQRQRLPHLSRLQTSFHNWTILWNKSLDETNTQSLSSSSSSSSSSSASMSTKLNSLVAESQALLLRENDEEKWNQLATVLKEWEAFLSLQSSSFDYFPLSSNLLADNFDNDSDSNNTSNDLHIRARTILNALYEQWGKAVAFPPDTTTTSTSTTTKKPITRSILSEAHAPLLPLWLHVYTYLCDGSRALQILEGWTVCFGAHLEWQPRRVHYDWVLQAYAGDKAPVQPPAEVALEILDLLDDFSFTMKPDVETYLWALQCLATGLSHPPVNPDAQQKAAHKLESGLRRAEHVVLSSWNDRPDALPLYMATMRRVLDTAARTVVELRYHSDGTEKPLTEMPLDGPTWTPWLQSWAHVLEHPATRLIFEQQQKQLLQEKEQEQQEQQQPHKNVQTTMALLPALGKCSRDVFTLYQTFASFSRRDPKEIAAEMQQILNAMEQLQKSFPTSPSAVLPQDYLCVMEAWHIVGDENATNKLLFRFRQQHERQKESMTREEAINSYNCLMKAFLMEGGYQEVFQLHRHMIKEGVWKDETTFHLILQSAMKSRQTNLVDKAMAMLRRTFHARRDARYVSLKTEHFTMVLQGLVDSRHKQAAFLALNVFQWCRKAAEEPGSSVSVEVEHYALFARAISKSGLPSCAEEILDLMESMTIDYGFEPSDKMRAALVAALGRKSSEEAAVQAEKLWQNLYDQGKADVPSYVAVMYAWMNSGAPDAMEHIAEVFNKLRLHRQGNPPDVTDRQSLDSIRVAYRAYLEALAKLSKEDAATRAVEVLRDFETNAQDGPADSKLYTAAMRAIWKSNEFNRHMHVEALYNRLLETAEANPNDYDVQPDALSLTVVMQAWAGSIDINKAKVVYDKWQNMVSDFQAGNLRMEPSAYAAAAVLHACAFTSTEKGDPIEAVDVALRVWQDIHEFSLINDELVAQLIRVFGMQMTDYEERLRLCTLAFQHACGAGCVTPKVLDVIRKYAPTFYKQIPRDSQNNLALPWHWTRANKKQGRDPTARSPNSAKDALT